MKTASSLAVLVFSVIGGLSACEDRQPTEPTQTAPSRAVPETRAAPETTEPKETRQTAVTPVAPESPPSADTAQAGDEAKEAREDEQSTSPASAPDARPQVQVPEPPVTSSSQGEQLIEDAQRAGWEITRDAEGNVILAPPPSQGTE